MIEGTNNRNSAPYGRFKVEITVMLLCRTHKLRPAGIHYRLIGAYHMLPFFQTTHDIFISRMDAAYCLHHKLYFGILFNHGKVRRDELIWNAGNMLSSRQNILDFNLVSALFLYLFAV